MKDQFAEPVFREINIDPSVNTGNLIKASKANVTGKTKISVEEEGQGSVKVILKKEVPEETEDTSQPGTVQPSTIRQ